jgi:cysteine synthase A
MLPDTGERYLSTPLFENISETMNEEELDISRSTPAARFDAPAAKPAAAPEPAAPEAKAVAFVEETIASRGKPVTLFALEWCEFCWSVRKFFAKVGIDYQAINLDSVEYQQDDWGGRIRAALRAKTGSVTIPQIFVGGEFIGGCTELFDAFKSGRLQKLLAANSVRHDAGASIDPYTFLPKWLQPRAT